MVQRANPPKKKHPNTLTTTDLIYGLGILQLDNQLELGIANKDDMLYIVTMLNKLPSLVDVTQLKDRLRKDLDYVNRLIIIQSELAKKRQEEAQQEGEKPKRGRKKK